MQLSLAAHPNPAGPVLCTLVPLPAITAWSTAAADSLVGPGGKQTEMHIAMAGEWSGHPSGAFAFTGAVFDQMIANFERQKTPLMIDYDHSVPNTGDTRAAGWILKLEKRVGNDGPELWALVELTKRAAEMVEAGEYRFNSPWFTMNGIDRVTGEDIGPELLNVALTNNPFLDGQKPLRLSRTGGDSKSFAAAVFAAAAPPPPPPKTKDDKDEDEQQAPAAPPPEGQQQPPVEGAPPAAEAQPPAPPPPGQTPESEQQRMLAEILTRAIDQMVKTAGSDRPGVVEMLDVMADQIGGLMRERLERDQTPAEERTMSANTDKDKSATPPASDEARIAAAAVRAAETNNDILLSKYEELKARLDAHDAKVKADKDAADAKRIAAMFANGVLKESEREDATWMLGAHPDRFESIYGKREGADKAVPINVRQAGPEVRASRTDATAAADGELPAELQNDDERNTYAFLLNRQWAKEKALSFIEKRRTKGASRRVG